MGAGIMVFMQVATTNPVQRYVDKRLEVLNAPAPPGALAVAQSGETDAAAARHLVLVASVERHAQEITPKQQMFAEVYVLTGNMSEAYRSAYTITDRRSSWHRTEAREVLAKPQVLRYVRELQRAAAQGVMVDVQELIASDLAIVQAAQHAEGISWHEWRNCRHCYGIDGAYQWIDTNEYGVALARWMDDNAIREARKVEPAPMPTDEGGYGFIGAGEPNIRCKQCEGRGHQHTLVQDTSKLGPAHPLYKGMKVTKNGIEVLLHDVDKAKERLYRATGSFGDDAASVARGAAAGAAAGGAAAAALAARVETMTADEARKAYLQLING